MRKQRRSGQRQSCADQVQLEAIRCERLPVVSRESEERDTAQDFGPEKIETEWELVRLVVPGLGSLAPFLISVFIDWFGTVRARPPYRSASGHLHRVLQRVSKRPIMNLDKIKKSDSYPDKSWCGPGPFQEER